MWKKKEEEEGAKDSFWISMTRENREIPDEQVDVLYFLSIITIIERILSNDSI